MVERLDARLKVSLELLQDLMKALKAQLAQFDWWQILPDVIFGLYPLVNELSKKRNSDQDIARAKQAVENFALMVEPSAALLLVAW